MRQWVVEGNARRRKARWKREGKIVTTMMIMRHWATVTSASGVSLDKDGGNVDDFKLANSSDVTCNAC